MVESCFAEDPVLHKNSPLQEYLNNLSFDDDGLVEDYFNKKQQRFELESSNCYAETFSVLTRRHWTRLRSFVSSVFPMSQSAVRDLCKRYYYEFGEEVVGSKIILDEDLDFLCLQTPQIFVDIVRKDRKLSGNNEQPEKDEQEVKEEKIKDSKNNYLNFSLIVLFLSLVLTSIYSVYFHIAVFALVLMFVIFTVRLKLTKEIWKRRLLGNLSIIKDLLNFSYKFLSTSRQSIKMAQELEVVSLGYSLVNGVTPAARLEQSSKNRDKPKSCVRLRSLVLKSTINCILCCREATLKVLKFVPNSNEPKGTNRFDVSLETLESLHPCLAASNDLEMFKHSDGYSLATLKVVIRLLRKQVSELVTQIFIALSASTWDFSNNGLLVTLSEVLKVPVQEFLKSCKVLRSCYEMHKYVTSVKPSGPRHPSSTGTSKELMIHLKSLQAHMRNALLMSIEMEERLSKADSGRDDGYATGLMDNIDHHIAVSADCLDKCKSSVCKPVEVAESEEDSLPQKPISASEYKPVNVEEVVREKDPVEFCEDQVFEAVVNKDEESLVSSRFDDEDEENLKVKREKSKHLLKELHSVLASKTSVEQREERKLKLFPNYKPKTLPVKNISSIKSIFSFCDQNKDESSFVADAVDDQIKLNPTCNGRKRISTYSKRPPSRSHRLKCVENINSELFTTEQVDSDASNVNGGTKVEGGTRDVKFSSGYGFSQALAAQAAAIARQQQTKTETFGDD